MNRTNHQVSSGLRYKHSGQVKNVHNARSLMRRILELYKCLLKIRSDVSKMIILMFDSKVVLFKIVWSESSDPITIKIADVTEKVDL